jgi:ribosomal protein S4
MYHGLLRVQANGVRAIVNPATRLQQNSRSNRKNICNKITRRIYYQRRRLHLRRRSFASLRAKLASRVVHSLNKHNQRLAFRDYRTFNFKRSTLRFNHFKQIRFRRGYYLNKSKYRNNKQNVLLRTFIQFNQPQFYHSLFNRRPTRLLSRVTHEARSFRNTLHAWKVRRPHSSAAQSTYSNTLRRRGVHRAVSKLTVRLLAATRERQLRSLRAATRALTSQPGFFYSCRHTGPCNKSLLSNYTARAATARYYARTRRASKLPPIPLALTVYSTTKYGFNSTAHQGHTPLIVRSAKRQSGLPAARAALMQLIRARTQLRDVKNFMLGLLRRRTPRKRARFAWIRRRSERRKVWLQRKGIISAPSYLNTLRAVHYHKWSNWSQRASTFAFYPNPIKASARRQSLTISSGELLSRQDALLTNSGINKIKSLLGLSALRKQEQLSDRWDLKRTHTRFLRHARYWKTFTHKRYILWKQLWGLRREFSKNFFKHTRFLRARYNAKRWRSKGLYKFGVQQFIRRQLIYKVSRAASSRYGAQQGHRSALRRYRSLVRPRDLAAVRTKRGSSSKSILFNASFPKPLVFALAQRGQTVNFNTSPQGLNFKSGVLATSELAIQAASLLRILVGQVLRQRLRNTRLNRSQARGLAKAIYWSLRVAMANGCDDRLFHNAYTTHLKVLTGAASTQPTKNFSKQLHSSRSALAPAGNTYSGSATAGAVSWLRQFFPRWYALYLEDPERYGRFMLEYHKLVRLRPTSHSKSEWLTNSYIPSLSEQNTTQSTFNSKDARFNNFMKTQNRPQLTVKTSITSNSSRTSFFKRSFSTTGLIGRDRLFTAHRRAELRQINQITSGEPQLSAYSALQKRQATASQRLMLRLSRYNASKELSFERTSRARSPRSGQYVVRSTALARVASRTLSRPIAVSHKSSRQARTHRRFWATPSYLIKADQSHLNVDKYTFQLGHKPILRKSSISTIFVKRAPFNFPETAKNWNIAPRILTRYRSCRRPLRNTSGRRGRLTPRLSYRRACAINLTRKSQLSMRRHLPVFHRQRSHLRETSSALSSYLKLARLGFKLSRSNAVVRYVHHAEARAALWHNITYRWFKRRRLIRRWVKRTGPRIKFLHEKLTGLGYTEDDLQPFLSYFAYFRKKRRALRRLEWRESDGCFEHDKLWKQFRFHPKERRRLPWLEPLIISRSVYSTRRKEEYRRYQLPKDEKRNKWLQRYRRQFSQLRFTNSYLRRRRWPIMRKYNERLFSNFYHLRSKKSARRHFNKQNRRRLEKLETGFAQSLRGLGDRLDVNAVLLNLAPTIFWARILIKAGVIFINGKIVTEPGFRLSAGDVIVYRHNALRRYQHYLSSYTFNKDLSFRRSTAAIPANFATRLNTCAIVFKRLPKESDLRKSHRLNGFMQRVYKQDVI